MVTVVILTHNSQQSIENTIKSVLWCDEIIIIDDNSIDTTKKIVSLYPISWYTHKLENDFAKQRNFGLNKAKYEWVLFIDDDEIVTPELKKEIQIVIKTDEINGFYIPRKDILFGKHLKYGETGKIALLRLARKTKGTWIKPVHEIWQITGRTDKLISSIHHFPHQSISEFVSKINFYSTLRANELHSNGIKTSLIDVIMYPLAKFILNYFLRLGFLDGIQGAILAIMMSFHSFLVRSKLYVLRVK